MNETLAVHKAQVSIYPLGAMEKIDEAIYRFWQLLHREGLEFRAGPLSTLVWGPADRIWTALQKGYVLLQPYGILMDVKITALGPDPDFDWTAGCLE